MVGKHIVVVAVLSLGIVALGVLAARTATYSSRVSQLSDELSALQTRVAAKETAPPPRTIIIEQPAGATIGQARSAAGVPSEATTTAQPPMDEEERAYRQNVIHAARSSLLNDAWQQESPDLRWAPRAVDLLHYTYQGEEFRDVEMQTECKTTLCRIVVKGANELAGQTAVQRITQLSPWPTSGIANYDIEKREGRVYLAREGFPLPQLDAQPDPLSGTE